MQIRSGLALVTAADHRVVTLDGITTGDAALLAAGQEFQFTGEAGLHYTIDSVLSVVPPVKVHLLNLYAGGVPFDTLTSYIIWAEFTPTYGFYLPRPGDANIRDAISKNAQLTEDALETFTPGPGPGGGAFVKQGIKAVTAGTFTVTVTPTSGTFPAPPYLVFATGSWINGGIAYSGRTTGQFVLSWAFEVPTGGAEISWGVV
jgi:hypothetical protein